MDKPREKQFRWSDEEIRAELHRILEHPEFKATARMREFLRFVVEQTLAGNARNLKGFTIAKEVFGRDENFDAAHDPVVRIQAGRLRRAIERYYLVAGSNDPIHIDVPKGAYVPVFSENAAVASDQAIGTNSGPAKRIESWPTILILPFRDMTRSEELSFLGPGLATDLAIELGNCSDLRVMLSGERLDRLTIRKTPDFVVQGSVQAEGSEVKVVVQLVSGDGAEQLWTDMAKTTLKSDELISFQEQAAAAISAHIAGEHGIIFRTLSRRLQPAKAKQLSSYEAILKSFAYHQTTRADHYVSALEALRQAHERDPHCGIVCSMLTVLYCDNIALEFFDLDQTPIDETLRLAYEGVKLEPESQLSRLALARALMLDGNPKGALAETESALELRPESLLFLDAIGYFLVLLGDWDRGEQLIRKSIQLNPFYRTFVRFGTWLNCFRQGDYQGALDELEWMDGVGYFWNPLSWAATLGQMGRQKESRNAVRELLKIKPDFPERGYTLIGHYIESPEIRERIIEGLAVGGLSLNSEPG